MNSKETNAVALHEQSEILRLSQVVLRAICSHDQQALEPILSPKFVLLGDSRRLDRRAFLEAVGSDREAGDEMRYLVQRLSTGV